MGYESHARPIRCATVRPIRYLRMGHSDDGRRVESTGLIPSHHNTHTPMMEHTNGTNLMPDSLTDYETGGYEPEPETDD